MSVADAQSKLTDAAETRWLADVIRVVWMGAVKVSRATAKHDGPPAGGSCAPPATVRFVT
jgi:hypothetical protein